MSYLVKLGLTSFILLTALSIVTSKRDSKKTSTSSTALVTKDYWDCFCSDIYIGCEVYYEGDHPLCEAFEFLCGAVIAVPCFFEYLLYYAACASDSADALGFDALACGIMYLITCNQCDDCPDRGAPHNITSVIGLNQTVFSIMYAETIKERAQLKPHSPILLSLGNQANIEKPNPNEQSCQYTSSDAKEIMKSLERSVIFYENNFDRIHPKAYGSEGLAVLNNQLLHLREKFDNGSKFHTYIEKLMDASQKLKNSTGKSERRYLGGAVITGPIDGWKSPEILSNFTGSFLNLGEEREMVLKFNGKKQCFNSVADNCNISTDCQKFFMKEAKTQEFLADQVKLMQLSKAKSCVLKSENGEVVQIAENYQEQLCAKTLEEANLLEKLNYPLLYRSLFAKQIAYCGMAGYPNFMRTEWMKEIISWQNEGEQGCFLEIYGEHFKTGDKVIKIQSPKENGVKITKDCLQDLTSASVSALSVQLRHMADICPQIFD